MILQEMKKLTEVSKKTGRLNNDEFRDLTCKLRKVLMKGGE